MSARKSFRSSCSAACAAIATLFVPVAARADAPLLLALDYDAPADCPAPKAFHERIESRCAERAFVLSSPQTAGLRIRVLVTTEDDGRFRSRITVVSPGAVER